ncbi:MAG: cupin domain-containing protein [Nitrospinae bacterium]|nr:cupin domain-containing protein [Nitrospinota bacterium]
MYEKLNKNVTELLKGVTDKTFVDVLNTESFKVACQKFNGSHAFRHLNMKHDEVLYVISGEIMVWTSEGEHYLKAGEILKIPKGIEHGDLEGKNVEILILEGKL